MTRLPSSGSTPGPGPMRPADLLPPSKLARPDAGPADDAAATATTGEGRLAENIMHFARMLRQAGLPIGPGRVLDAIRAVITVGVTSRADFYWALHAVFVNRRDQHDLFDQAFHVFWRNPKILERMMALVLPSMKAPEATEPEVEMNRRLAEALAAPPPAEAAEEDGQEQVEIDAVMTFSASEILQAKDFEKMSTEEMRQAKALLRRLRLPVAPQPTRRFRPDPRAARIDMRATLRAALRAQADALPLRRRRPRKRTPPLVVLCDISGSMDRYARMILHFLHALTNDRDRVHTFVFGTRLTNVSRYLRHKDVDEALDKVSKAVIDWAGGTRIGACLHDFNRHWSRRVLGQGAVLLLITDGLDRDAGDGLAPEMERLHKSCRRLIWLNPLLRFEGFAPRSSGVRAILPHVDEFRLVHNLDSLAALAAALQRPAKGRDPQLDSWLRKAQ